MSCYRNHLPTTSIPSVYRPVPSQDSLTGLVKITITATASWPVRSKVIKTDIRNTFANTAKITFTTTTYRIPLPENTTTKG